MNRIVLIICTLPLSGCLLEVLTTTAIQGELAAQDAQSATRALEHAQTSTARMEAEHAISAYAAEHGQYPPSLQALVPAYLAEVPKTPSGAPYGYDPRSGTLLDGPAGGSASRVAFTEADRTNLERLQEAIYTYWESTGYYPRTLDDLDPLYIDKVPRLSSGGSFVYKPKTGAVYHPSELQSSRAIGTGPSYRGNAAGNPVAGPGPLGEVATSLAIQDELSSMNQRGAQRSGNVARRSVSGMNRDYNQRQQRAIDQLNP